MKEGNIDTATPTARTAPVAGIAAAAGKAPAAGKATLVAEKPADEPDPPRVWLIDPYRAGERSQVRAIADALQWPYEIKHLGYRKLAARVNLLRGSDLSGLISATRPQLRAPWPQLLITAGMRNEPVCRWIQDQSGGRARIVHIGRPWADPTRFDLVITTPQYRLPKRSNVLHNGLTLHGIDAARLASVAEAWRPRLGDLAPPYVGVILGGSSGPFTFGPAAARRLAAQANELATRLGASLLISTSSRTDPAAVAVLEQGLSRRYQLYHWQPDDDDNPYLAYLGLSDELIVTADSISMLSEACATGRPVRMFDLNVGAQAMSGGNRAPGDNDFRLTAHLYRALINFGPRRLSRDISLIHQRLLADGQACWLGEGSENLRLCPPLDLQQAVARVRALFER